MGRMAGDDKEPGRTTGDNKGLKDRIAGDEQTRLRILIMWAWVRETSRTFPIQALDNVGPG